MLRSCCLQCRLRFADELAAGQRTCPFCGAPLNSTSARDAVGCRLLAPGWMADDDDRVDRAARRTALRDEIHRRR